MKNIIGLILCMGVALFSTSVSFASDGPETTKDCVIDNLNDVEAFIVMDQNFDASLEVHFNKAVALADYDYSAKPYEAKADKVAILKTDLARIGIGYHYNYCYRPMRC